MPEPRGDIQYGLIAASSSGDNTIIAAVPNKRLTVHAIFILASAATTVRLESGAGGTALTGQMQLPGNGGFVLPYNEAGWFSTADGAVLNLELSAANSCDGCVVYAISP